MPCRTLLYFIIHCSLISGLIAAEKAPVKKVAVKKAVAKKIAEKAMPLNGNELFEKKIKPILVKYCYECHSKNGKDIEGGLELDSPSGMLKGGDSGPMLMAHHVNKSAIIKMLEHDDDVSGMPPEKKLPKEVIEAFKEWIKLGAPDTRKDIGPTEKAKRLEKAKKHWSFQPLKSTTPPAVKLKDWPRNNVIDNYVLAQMEAKGLKPVPDANKKSLVRRVYFDLVGLPPTPAEVDEFIADQSPEALAKLIDRLLDTPQFGERWGRHWLDVVRYAESSGMEFNFTYPHAWPYRNYVINSINADKPYNQFLKEQIAGDLLPTAKEDTPEVLEARKIATGVLSFGSKRHNSGGMDYRMNIVDDQINMVTRSMLALTVSCARCHDHKFDPVPTKDYYSLAGIFLSTEPLYGTIKQKYSNNPTDLLPIGPNAKALHETAEAHKKKLQEAEKVLTAKKAELKKADEALKVSNTKKAEAEKQLMALTKPKEVKKPKPAPKKAPAKPVKKEVAKKELAQKESLAEEQLEPKKEAPKKVVPKKAAPKVKPAEVKPPAKKAVPKKAVPQKATPKKVISPEETARKNLEASIKVQKDAKTKAEKLKTEVKPLEAKVTEIKKQQPPRPQYAMMARERAKPADIKVAIRGDYRQAGELAPRGFLSIINLPKTAKVDPKHSGRMELANWITSPDNPLTARVMVNRIWHHLLGKGIVPTTDNFGLIGKAPTHPELLDALSIQFMKEGWSVKKMVKAIMLSRTYQLSCHPDQENLKSDPLNQSLWRASPRRLEAETIRDAILSISGQINLEQLKSSTVTSLGDQMVRGIAPEKIQPSSNYRSVYLPVVRDYVPEIFDLFDFPSPSLVTGSRSVTNVPSQALYLRNSKFVAEQSKHAANRLLATQSAKDDNQRIQLAFRWTLARNATPDELAGTLELIQQVSKVKPDDPKQKVTAWAALFQTIFTTAEFRYLVDIK